MTSASDRWRAQVEAHHEQSLRAQEGLDLPEDFWQPYASIFREDPHRRDDPLVERLSCEVTSDGTVIDVGGGAGRLALPLALRCRWVTVVEPSPSMVGELRDAAAEAGIGNVTAVEEDWEDAEVTSADVSICSHVVYGVAEIVPFVRKLCDKTVGRVLILLYTESPMAQLSPFWWAAHREERVELPAMPELLPVLWEMGIYPDVEMLEPTGVHVFESREDAVETLRQRIYVAPGSEEDGRLADAASKLLVERPDGVVITGAQPRRQVLFSWRPEPPSPDRVRGRI